MRCGDPRVRKPGHSGGVPGPFLQPPARETPEGVPMRSRFERLAVARQFLFPLVFLLLARSVLAAGASVTGTVSDQLGGPIAQAAIAVMRDGQHVGDTTSDARGAFMIDGLAEGRYQLDVTANGFARHTTDPVFVSGDGRAAITVILTIGPLTQQVVVTAAASAVPEAQA